MFNKKTCKKCGEKTKPGYNFCPNCGNPLKKQEDWGMLGKNDNIQNESSPFHNAFMGNNKMLNNMLGNAMKMLEKEMKKVEDKNQPNNFPKTNFKLMINGKEIKPNLQPKQSAKKPIKKIPKNEFNEEQLKKYSELEKENPKTNLKRIGEKIIYEIGMPGVKSLKNIMTNQLESSIEIKAIGKTRAYKKTIPLNAPITNQILEKEKLILELKG